MLDLVGNPKTDFSHDAANILTVLLEHITVMIHLILKRKKVL